MEDLELHEQLEENKQQCTNCKVFRVTTDFIGKSGNPVSRCLKCREKDDKQKQRPDVIEKRKQRQNEKKYYKTYREKKRSENEEEFLKNNSEVAKEWRSKNKEHLAKWQTQNFKARFRAIKTQAQKKGILWNEDLTDELCYEMMTSNCFYCNHVPDKSLNGIDRMDSNGNYEKMNTVSCCKNCNFMKGSLDPNTFLKRCQHISKHFNGYGDYNNGVWSNSISVSYNSYLKRAAQKDLEFALTVEQFNSFINGCCYYCNKENTESHKNGIDRKNNTIGYVFENCVTCCGECNYMKGSLSSEEFIDTCKKVSEYNMNRNMDIPVIEKCENKISKRVKKEIAKEPIIITKQQPNKDNTTINNIDTVEYTPIQRVYKKGSNLPADCAIKAEDIPKYCYYVPATKTRGDGFCCGRQHPKQKELNTDWSTTKSKSVSTEEKFKSLLEYLK